MQSRALRLFMNITTSSPVNTRPKGQSPAAQQRVVVPNKHPGSQGHGDQKQAASPQKPAAAQQAAVPH